MEKGNVPAVLNGFAGEPQRGLDVPAGHYRIAGSYFAQRSARLKQLKNVGHHDAGPFEARLAVTNPGIHGNIILPAKSSAHRKNNISLIDEAVKKETIFMVYLRESKKRGNYSALTAKNAKQTQRIQSEYEWDK